MKIAFDYQIFSQQGYGGISRYYNKLALEFLKAGKDVLVEKPLSLNIKDGYNLVKYANENNRILMVGHVLEYHPAIVKIQQMISFLLLFLGLADIFFAFGHTS